MDNWISICVSEYIVHNTRIGTEIYATIVYATDAICLPPQRLSQNFFPIMNTYFKITRPRNGHQENIQMTIKSLLRNTVTFLNNSISKVISPLSKNQYFITSNKYVQMEQR
eukprot:233893_1